MKHIKRQSEAIPQIINIQFYTRATQPVDANAKKTAEDKLKPHVSDQGDFHHPGRRPMFPWNPTCPVREMQGRSNTYQLPAIAIRAALFARAETIPGHFNHPGRLVNRRIPRQPARDRKKPSLRTIIAQQHSTIGAAINSVKNPPTESALVRHVRLLVIIAPTP